MRLKYVVTDSGDFAIFTELTKHSDIAPRLFGKPVGAGFCSIAGIADTDMAKVHCWGESISLGIESRPEDEQIINKYVQ